MIKGMDKFELGALIVATIGVVGGGVAVRAVQSCRMMMRRTYAIHLLNTQKKPHGIPFCAILSLASS